MPVTGAVLAGGRSSRLGRDKALLEIDGETLLVRAVRTLSSVCDAVLIVGPCERTGVVPGVRVAPDERPGVGPLGGIATALRAMRGEYLLAVATDMPLLNPALLRYLIELAPGHDLVVPRTNGRTQQLHAVYARTCLPPIDEQLAGGDFRVARLLDRVRARIVEEVDVRRLDPMLHSFRNVNTAEDWDAVQGLVRAEPMPG